MPIPGQTRPLQSPDELALKPHQVFNRIPND